MTDELLPALPEPSLMTHLGNVGFTADQLHAYAREAIRLAQAEREVAMWAYRRAGGGAWHPVLSSKHRANTEASPEWEVATLYYLPSPPAGEVA